MVISKEDSAGKINMGTGNMVFFTGGSGDPAFSFAYTVKLKMPVDEKIYQQAVKKALERFWNYRVRPMLDANGKLYFVNNTNEPVVFHDDGQTFELGTDEVANYLFVALYKDNSIKIRAFHGIADGRGGLEFIKAVVYHYLVLSGYTNIKHDDVLTTEIPEDESERVCEYETFGRMDAEPFYMFEQDKVYVANEDTTPLEEKRTVRYMVRCDAKELLAKVKEMRVTVTPWLNTILGRAFYQTYTVAEDEQIVGTCPVDGRAEFGVKSLVSFGTTIKLLYDKRFNDFDFATAVRMERALMELQLTRANFEKEFALTMLSTNQLLEMLPNSKVLVAKQFTDALANAPAKSTYTISNIGVLKFNDDMQRYVEDIQVESVCKTKEITCIIITFNNHMDILFSQGFESSALADKVAELIKEQGVGAEVSRLPDYYTDKLLYNF